MRSLPAAAATFTALAQLRCDDLIISKGENVYYGLGTGGLAALNMATGKQLWFSPVNAPGVRAGTNAAATMIPGAVFLGGNDGKEPGSADGAFKRRLIALDRQRREDGVGQPDP